MPVLAVGLLVAAVADLTARVLTPSEARSAVRPLASPLAFVVFAVPLAVLLDRVGVFEALARLAAHAEGRGPPRAMSVSTR